MNINLDNYNVVKMIDNYDWTITGVILLNNKHNIDDFRDAIKQAKIKHEDDIYEYGCDWDFIEQELDDYDYIVLDFTSDSVEY